jgi:hypothetical protein
VAGVSTSYTYQDPQWGIQGLGAVDLGFARPSVLEWHAVTPARFQVPPSRGRRREIEILVGGWGDRTPDAWAMDGRWTSMVDELHHEQHRLAYVY